jgi:hypothetical protein
MSKVSTIGLDLAKNMFGGLVFCSSSRCSPSVRFDGGSRPHRESVVGFLH